MLPTISIIVTSYNYDQYIGDCLDSILSQTFTDFEAIIVDDGSTDNSMSVINEFVRKDKRLKLYQHCDKANHGLIQTISLATSLCRGRYIAFLESDDMWDQNCLSTRIKLLSLYPNCKFIFNNLKLIIEQNAKNEWYENNVVSLMNSNYFMSYSRERPIPFNLEKELIIENRIPTFSCAMIERNLLINLSFMSPVEKWIDWWLWVQASQLTDFLYTAEKLTYWRIHEDSFNHKSTLQDYFKNNKLMWAGFSALPQNKTKKIILYFPAFLRILARTALTYQRLGAVNTLMLALNKFK